MPKKREDPFIAELWSELIAAKLGPTGHGESWADTPVRIRNRFTKAVREAMHSPAALAASTEVIPVNSTESAKRR